MAFVQKVPETDFDHALKVVQTLSETQPNNHVVRRLKELGTSLANHSEKALKAQQLVEKHFPGVIERGFTRSGTAVVAATSVIGYPFVNIYGLAFERKQRLTLNDIKEVFIETFRGEINETTAKAYAEFVDASKNFDRELVEFRRNYINLVTALSSSNATNIESSSLVFEQSAKKALKAYERLNVTWNANAAQLSNFNGGFEIAVDYMGNAAGLAVGLGLWKQGLRVIGTVIGFSAKESVNVLINKNEELDPRNFGKIRPKKRESN